MLCERNFDGEKPQNYSDADPLETPTPLTRESHTPHDSPHLTLNTLGSVRNCSTPRACCEKGLHHGRGGSVSRSKVEGRPTSRGIRPPSASQMSALVLEGRSPLHSQRPPAPTETLERKGHRATGQRCIPSPPRHHLSNRASGSRLWRTGLRRPRGSVLGAWSSSHERAPGRRAPMCQAPPPA